MFRRRQDKFDATMEQMSRAINQMSDRVSVVDAIMFRRRNDRACDMIDQIEDAHGDALSRLRHIGIRDITHTHYVRVTPYILMRYKRECAELFTGATTPDRNGTIYHGMKVEATLPPGTDPPIQFWWKPDESESKDEG